MILLPAPILFNRNQKLDHSVVYLRIMALYAAVNVIRDYRDVHVYVYVHVYIWRGDKGKHDGSNLLMPDNLVYVCIIQIHIKSKNMGKENLRNFPLFREKW